MAIERIEKDWREDIILDIIFRDKDGNIKDFPPTTGGASLKFQLYTLDKLGNVDNASKYFATFNFVSQTYANCRYVAEKQMWQILIDNTHRKEEKATFNLGVLRCLCWINKHNETLMATDNEFNIAVQIETYIKLVDKETISNQ